MQSILLFYYSGVFVLGLIIGSFLNCVIYRLEKSEGLWGRSYCPNCKHVLKWSDLIPIFSFLYLIGRCKYCKKKISWQYPIIEFITGMLFLLVTILYLPIFQISIYYFLLSIISFYIISSLIVIFVYDLKHYIIPDKILFPAIIILFFYRLFENSNFEFVISNQFFNYLTSIFIAAGFFLFIFLISSGKWIGFGDVKLAILLGLILGFPNILTGLFLAFLLGSAVGLFLMLYKVKGLKSEVPFAPFLILGTVLAMFWGNKILNWYISYFVS